MRKFLILIFLLLLTGIAVGLTLFVKKTRDSIEYNETIQLNDSLVNKSDSIYTEESYSDSLPDITGFSVKNNYPQNYFKLPVNYDPFISGTFGELRSNHFHAGLDIRTNGTEGKAVIASASGYVSRIVVSASGYGKALYITHPNGFTTVYAHLQRFNEQIEWFVRKHQYQKESFTIELFPEKGLLEVKGGDMIAFSGNTGGSGGPHLHFEIRKSSTQEPVNPLLFGLPVKDNLAPEISSFILYSMDKNHRQITGWYPRTVYPLKKSQSSTQKQLVLNVPSGKYAAGAVMTDYFRSKSENLGVNYSKLFVNDKLIYEFAIEKLRFDNQRQMNTHMDFCIHKEDNKKPHKLFIDDGNRLNLYNVHNKGIFELTDTCLIKLFVMDLSGRSDSIEVLLKATTPIESEIQLNEQTGACNACSPDNYCLIKNEAVLVSIPKNILYHHYDVCIKKESDRPDAVSSVWNIGDFRVPVHSYYSLSIKTEKEIPEKYKSKLLIVEWFKRKKYPIGGTYKNGMVTANVRDFGNYFIAIDTIPPVIKVINFDPKSEFRFKLTDNLSEVKYYRAAINGNWLLMEFEPKTGILSGVSETVQEKGKHHFKLIVRDERGNETIFERKFEIL